MKLLFPLFLLAAFADADRTLKVVPSKSLPAIESILVYASESIKPGKDRPKPVFVWKFDKGVTSDATTTLGEGPFHITVKPKDGIEVLVAAKLNIKPSQTHELKLGDLLGVVEVFQKEGFPKVDRIVLTAPDDSGPDEKGHVAVQVGSDYRVEMPVTEGFYAVWLVPANGARAQRIEERLRVLPGKNVRVGD